MKMGDHVNPLVLTVEFCFYSTLTQLIKMWKTGREVSC